MNRPRILFVVILVFFGFVVGPFAMEKEDDKPSYPQATQLTEEEVRKIQGTNVAKTEKEECCPLLRGCCSLLCFPCTFLFCIDDYTP